MAGDYNKNNNHDILISRGLLHEQSHYIWQNVTSTPLLCIQSPHFVVHTINKFFRQFITINCGKADKLEEFHEAISLITDLKFAKNVYGKSIYNWPRCTKRVVALSVPEDGNSLIHAVSVSLLGVTNQASFFQHILSLIFNEHRDFKSPLAYRWSHEVRKRCNESRSICTEEGLRRKWSEICHHSSLRSSKSESLKSSSISISQFFTFVLANVCRRIIVVVGEKQQDFQSSVYIPVMISADECVRCPIYLAHHEGHYAPLIYMEDTQTGKTISDPCIPIMDVDFNLFQFPFLLQNENGLSLLEKYALKTTIAYTTSTETKEVTALRSPDGDFTSNSTKSGPDTNLPLRTVFDIIYKGGRPVDVAVLWEATWKLRVKPEDDLQDVGNDYLSHVSQSMGGSMQPVGDEDEEDEGMLLPENSGSMSRSLGPTDSFSHEVLRTETTYSEPSNNHDLDASLNIDESTRSGDSTTPTAHSVSTETRIESSASAYPRDAATFEQNIETKPLMQNDEISIHPNMHDIEPEGNNNPCVGINYLSAVHDFGSLSPGPASNRSGQMSGANAGSDLTPVSQLASNHVRLTNCRAITSAVFSLKSLTLDKQVEVKLEKISNTEIKLSFRNSNDLEVHYERTLGDDLDAELKFVQRNHYRLCFVLPSCVLIPQRHLPDFSLVMMQENEEDPSYVSLEDHPSKCRTDGCIRRGVKHHRNLCDLCYQSWSEKLQPRQSDNSASLSYLDSISSTESSFDSRKCKTRNCNNMGEARCYGYCETCFCTPAE